MVRAPCCEKMGMRKGPWAQEEDLILVSHIQRHGHGNWRALPKQAGLLRCGKSCRLRWINYLRPDIKRGNFSKEEEDLIIRSHEMLGNRWSAIAAKLPGRTDNEIKNVWHTHLKKRLIPKEQQQESKPRKARRHAKKKVVSEPVTLEPSTEDPVVENPSENSSFGTGGSSLVSGDDNHGSVGEESMDYYSGVLPDIDDSFWSMEGISSPSMEYMTMENPVISRAEPACYPFSDPCNSMMSSNDGDHMNFWLNIISGAAGDIQELLDS